MNKNRTHLKQTNKIYSCLLSSPLRNTPKKQNLAPIKNQSRIDPGPSLEVGNGETLLLETEKKKKNRDSNRNSINFGDQFNEEELKIQLKPIRLIGQDIRRKISKNSLVSLISSQSFCRFNPHFKLPPLSCCVSTNVSSFEKSSIEIKMGSQKVNQKMEIYFSNILGFPETAQLGSYLYCIIVSSGMIQGKSSLSLLETLNESKIVLKYNKRMIKNLITLAFYQIKLPEALSTRKKLGYLIINLQQSENLMKLEPNKKISLQTIVWDEKDEEIQQLKIYLQIHSL